MCDEKNAAGLGFTTPLRVLLPRCPDLVARETRRRMVILSAALIVQWFFNPTPPAIGWIKIQTILKQVD